MEKVADPSRCRNDYEASPWNQCRRRAVHGATRATYFPRSRGSVSGLSTFGLGSNQLLSGCGPSRRLTQRHSRFRLLAQIEAPPPYPLISIAKPYTSNHWPRCSTSLGAFVLGSFNGFILGSAAGGRRPLESADPRGPACGAMEGERNKGFLNQKVTTGGAAPCRRCANPCPFGVAFGV